MVSVIQKNIVLIIW